MVKCEEDVLSETISISDVSLRFLLLLAVISQVDDVVNVGEDPLSSGAVLLEK